MGQLRTATNEDIEAVLREVRRLIGERHTSDDPHILIAIAFGKAGFKVDDELLARTAAQLR